VKEHWDPSKSPTVNLANMGLRAKPNHADGKVSPTDNSKVIELFDIPESDKLNKPKKMPLCEQDQQYIAKCLEKHGDDYHSMFMDTKTNKMQHTETRLRKMASRFLLLESDQRIVELPDKVKHLVSKS
jgi:nucleolar protein 16